MMKKRIEVYVKNEEITVSYPLLKNYFLLDKWDIIPWSLINNSSCKLKIIPEKDQEAIEIARKLSEKLGAELKVYDVCKLEGKILAYLKNVKKTPTIIIGKNKIEDLEHLIYLKN